MEKSFPIRAGHSLSSATQMPAIFRSPLQLVVGLDFGLFTLGRIVRIVPAPTTSVLSVRFFSKLWTMFGAVNSYMAMVSACSVAFKNGSSVVQPASGLATDT